MTVHGARHIPDGTDLVADICIIGSGAAGLTLADRLDGSSQSIVMLEAGGMERDQETELDAFTIDQLGVPQANLIESRGRWFGGATNLWFGRIATLDPIDFEQRPWVPHSGWPISSDELEPWLRTAATLLQVPNFDKIHIDSWERNPTIDLANAHGKASLSVFLWTDVHSMIRRGHELIKRSADLRLVLDATVIGLVPNANSSTIESISVVGPALNRFSVSAKKYILAAGGFENPRLLLASTCRSPVGVGNERDVVGRYFMDHPRGEGLGSADLTGLSTTVLQRLRLLGERARSPYGPAQLRLTFPASVQRNEELLNHSLHCHLASAIHGSPDYLAVRDRMAADFDRLLAPGLLTDLASGVRVSPQLMSLAIRNILRRERPTSLIVIDQMEQVPDPASRVTVDLGRLDRCGLPRLSLDWRISDATFASQRRMHQLFASIAAQAGVGTFRSSLLIDEPTSVPVLDMKHPSGTTRMSVNPRTGVVDSNCRVHSIDNLYIAGSSVFPTVGHANPTLTIVALAARLARHLGGRAPDTSDHEFTPDVNRARTSGARGSSA